jgi:hypothetical protein
MSDGTEPVTDDEILYRRVQKIHGQGGYVDPKAFHPNKHDRDGLSLFRRKYYSKERLCENCRGKQYYVASVRALDVRKLGLHIVPTPPFDIGHVSLPEWNYKNRKMDRFVELERICANEVVFELDGPFPNDETH